MTATVAHHAAGVDLTLRAPGPCKFGSEQTP